MSVVLQNKKMLVSGWESNSGSDHGMARNADGCWPGLHAFLSMAVAINAGFVSEGISQPICIVAKILSKGLETT